jgi:hypothetical protein
LQKKGVGAGIEPGLDLSLPPSREDDSLALFPKIALNHELLPHLDINNKYPKQKMLNQYPKF